LDTLKLSVALRQAQGRIIGRAWEDEDFEKALMADPRAAIKQAAGIDIPAGVTVTVVQETENTLYLILPRNPLGNAEGELSEEALATVAGGLRGTPTQPGYPDPSCQ
jgi:hypothetical protein